MKPVHECMHMELGLFGIMMHIAMILFMRMTQLTCYCALHCVLRMSPFAFCCIWYHLDFLSQYYAIVLDCRLTHPRKQARLMLDGIVRSSATCCYMFVVFVTLQTR